VQSRPYVVADLVPGRPLADLLADGPLSPDAVRALAVDLAGVLGAVHGRGLVPGDLTPENVVVDPNGVAHLVDLGFSPRPPDHGRGAGPDRGAPDGDLRRLGELVFRCLTGRPAAESDDVRSLVGGDALAAFEEAGDLALCGRDAELAVLADRWARARHGSGGAVLIGGGPGTGKSRLAREVTAALRAGSGAVLHARCVPDGGPGPALRAVLDEDLPDLARRRGGLLVHLDDVQWLDPESVRRLGTLADQLPAAPLLLIATARPGPARSESAFRGALGTSLDTELTVGPLDAAGVRELISVALPGPGGRPTAPGASTDRLSHRLAATGRTTPGAVLDYLRRAVDVALLRPGWAGWELDERELELLDLP
jgi:hypothetical protein